MKVPPLNQLYQHQQHYQAHKNKLHQIQVQRKQHLSKGSSSQGRERPGMTPHMKSWQVDHDNLQLKHRIDSVKASLNIKREMAQQQNKRRSNSSFSQMKQYDMDRESSRLKEKVNSLSSSLSR